MTSDDSNLEPPNAVVHAAQGLKEFFPRIHKENEDNTSRPQSSNRPDTPTPPPSSTPYGTRPPEPIALLEKYQVTLRHLHTLEGHNARLYEDNCRLVNAVNTLNDRLAFMGAPQNTQLIRLADVQERLRASEASRALINQKYQELLQCASVASTQHHLYDELQAIREAYASLDRDYRLLTEKYARLKAAADASRVAQQPSKGPIRLVPVVRPEVPDITQFRAHDQGRNTYASPTSAVSAASFRPMVDQKGHSQRRNSETIIVQSPLRSGPAPVTTTLLTPLPTPPTATPLGSLILPTGFPVHAAMPAGSLPLSHHPHIIQDLRTTVTHSRCLARQGPPEQPGTTVLRQHCGDIGDTTNCELVPRGKQNSAMALLTSSSQPSKRPSSELQTSTSPGEGHKKPRVEGETERPMTTNTDAHAADKIPVPPVSTDSLEDHKSFVPASSVRSYEDCVGLIFEKDANVENGVFCGLCFDRHEAKMVPEPPDVLIQPDFDYLVKHCMTMHPAVWDDLRRMA